MERWAEMEDPTARQLKEAEATVQAMEVSAPHYEYSITYI
jgi:hypothetical protein